MSKLRLFPLNIVAYPGEIINLHIFEPRYQQLVNECVDKQCYFGIPTFMNNRLPGYGTEMEIVEVVKRYDDGQMDIRTKGVRVFRILAFENPAAGKLYAHADVFSYNEPPQYPQVLPNLQESVEKLYKLLSTSLKHSPDKPQPYSYQVGHGVGMSIEDEYELLTLETEYQRQEFLIAHLQNVLPVVENMERTKERIRMNGDFREFGELRL